MFEEILYRRYNFSLFPWLRIDAKKSPWINGSGRPSPRALHSSGAAGFTDLSMSLFFVFFLLIFDWLFE